MIDHIEIEGFKSLQKVSLDLGPLNIFIGGNASGKTNFLEALRLLQGIAYGYSIEEILHGRPKRPHSDAWDGIRGGARYATFARSGGDPICMRLTGSFPPASEPVEYSVRISSENEAVAVEQFSLGGKPLPAELGLARGSAFHAFRQKLSEMQFLDPSASVLREYSSLQRATRMRERGGDFAALIRTILKNRPAGAAYTAWLQQLTPREVEDVLVLPGADKDWLFAVRKDGAYYPASVLSDGTLRFAGIAAAFFQPEPPQTLLLEAIENGLDPSRLRLLVELLKSQAGKTIPQVMATSHSPYAISSLAEEDYRTVFLCSKDETTGATCITPLSQIPRLMELARRQTGADFFAEEPAQPAL